MVLQSGGWERRCSERTSVQASSVRRSRHCYRATPAVLVSSLSTSMTLRSKRLESTQQTLISMQSVCAACFPLLCTVGFQQGHLVLRLRSANTQQLAIPRTNTGYGDRSFAVSWPSVWNSLPTALWMSDCSLTTFRTQLKTLLFIWYIVHRQLHFLTAGQCICGLLEGILIIIIILNIDWN